MAQTIVYPLNKFESLNAMNMVPPVSHIELADQTVSTTGTVFAVQDFGIAGLRHARVRIRVKGIAAADSKQFTLRVSTTSAMTAPEVNFSVTASPLTTDVWDVDLGLFSVTGFRYAELRANLTTTVTADVVLEADA